MQWIVIHCSQYVAGMQHTCSKYLNRKAGDSAVCVDLRLFRYFSFMCYILLIASTRVSISRWVYTFSVSVIAPA